MLIPAFAMPVTQIRSYLVGLRDSKYPYAIKYLLFADVPIELVNMFYLATSSRTDRLKAMTHDATSFMGFGFMKPVSQCDGAKTCCKGLLKVPCDCFYDRALLYSCNVFHETFLN